MGSEVSTDMDYQDTYNEQLLEGMRIKCENKTGLTPPSVDETTTSGEDELYCEQAWDGIYCWEATRAGVLAVKKCPEYLDYAMEGSNEELFATRACMENGTWWINPETNEGWSNYSQCLSVIPQPYDPFRSHQQRLQIMYSIGYGLSLIALIVAMCIFLYFRKLRCPRNTIHMHFFVSFIFRAILVFIRDIMQAQVEASQAYLDVGFGVNTTSTNDYQTPWCRMAFTLMQYFLVTNYYWLLVEGVYLHSLITLAVFSGRTSLRYYFALGWGFPAVIVLVWATCQVVQHTPGCWWENVTSSPTYWIIKAPVMISILVNFVLFLNITRVLATKLRASNAAEARVYSKLAKSTLVLIPIFGVYYFITVGMHASDNETVTLVRMYVDILISPFQGVIMAFLYCFLNGDVQAEIKRKWTVHKINRTLSSNTRSVAVNHRSQAHSRSSESTPPRKDSVDAANKGGHAGGNRGRRQRFSFIGRVLAIKSRLFQRKNSPKVQMNGSVENYRDSPTKKSGNDISKNGSELPALCEEQPTETTKLNQGDPPDPPEKNGLEEIIVDELTPSSEKDELIKDDDSGHVRSGDSRSPSLTNEKERESKKGVHFASNIETEV